MKHIARTSVVVPLSLAIAWTWLVGAAAAQTPLFEVEKSDATKVLQVNDDGGFVARGELDAGTIPATGGGTRLMWYPKKAAFRAGWVDSDDWDDPNIGRFSVAFGDRSRASGDFSMAHGNATATGHGSIALGYQAQATAAGAVALGSNAVASAASAVALSTGSTASGDFSTTLGLRTIASGHRSTAIGSDTKATGYAATAMGENTTASGEGSTAMGRFTTAAGFGSVAMGSFVSAGTGSFVFGDRSSSDVQAAGDNQFLVRAYGGVGFNSAPLIGCDLPPGAGAWSCTSSRLAKEGFEDVDGEMVLDKLAGIRIQRWYYLGTQAAHVGPTAEDFHGAFGLGEGPTTITTVDADGIALLGVQTLERRTVELQSQTADLRAENTELRSENAELRAGHAEIRRRLEALEAERTPAAR